MVWRTRQHAPLIRWLAGVLAVLAVLLSGTSAWAQFRFGGEIEDKFEVRLLGENDEPTPPRDGPLKVIGLDDRPELKNHIEDLAYESRVTIRETTRIDWRGTALIVWTDNERDYLAQTGKLPEFTAAAANADYRTVWINGAAWKRATSSEQRQVLTHELGHLLLGHLPGGDDLPLWAEEGIVMHLAGEWDFNRSLAVSRAHSFGQLPALGDLELQFPRDPEQQQLAYAVGYLAVDEIARDLGDERGKITRLMRRIADKEEGPKFEETLWDRDVREGWNIQMLDSLGGRTLNLILVLTSGTTIWLLAMVLLWLAWKKKKRRRELATARELAEEPWLESLSEGDMQDIWGDRDERWRNRPEPARDAQEVENEYPWEKWERLQAEEREEEHF